MSLQDVPKLFVSQIVDTYSRENFRKIGDFFRQLSLFSNFKVFTLSFTAAEDHHKFTHNLGFLPKDIIVTSKTGSGTVTFNQDLSDTINLDITATGACEIRFLAGAFN